MTVFLWTVLVIWTLSIAGMLIWLVKGEIPQRTPASLAFTVFFDACFVAWAAVLLFR